MTYSCRVCKREAEYVLRGRFMCPLHFFVWLTGGVDMHGLRYADRVSAWKLVDALAGGSDA